MSRDSRKIFRLFKSINELQQLNIKLTKDLVRQPNKTPVYFDILSRIGFFFYWIFDNIQILASIKFIKADPSYYLKLASWGWFVGIIFGIAKHLYDLIDLMMRKQSKSVDEAELKRIDQQILRTIIDIIGKLGDLVTASNGIGLPQKLFGKGFSDGTIGIAGFVAALVSLFNLYAK